MGNKYFGNKINTTDMKILNEYEVDKKYREDILEQVYEKEYNSDNKKIMDNYLRKILR